MRISTRIPGDFQGSTNGRQWDAFRSALYRVVEDDVSSRLAGDVQSRTFFDWRRVNQGVFEYGPYAVLVPTEAAVWHLLHSQAYTELKATAAAVDVDRHFSDLVGANGWSALLDLQTFVLRTLSIVVQQSGDRWAIDQPAIDRRVAELTEILERPSVRQETVILMDPVALRDRIALAPDVEIVPLPDDDLLDLIRIGLIPARFQAGRAPYVEVGSGGRVAVRVTTFAAKTRGAAAPSDFRIPQLADSTFSDVADVVALATGSCPRMIGWAFRPSCRSMPIGITHRAIGVPSRDERRPITIEEPEEIVRAYGHVARMSVDPVRLAIRRIGHAASRESAQDRLVDCIIAAEAVFSDRQSGLKGKPIANRAAALWPSESMPMSAADVEAIMLAAYRARNGIVHGDTAPYQLPATFGAKTIDTIEALADSVLVILRSIVLRQVQCSTVPSVPWN